MTRYIYKFIYLLNGQNNNTKYINLVWLEESNIYK